MVFFLQVLCIFPIIIMERLVNTVLSDQEKQYLIERARDGVCKTQGGHECYLGMVLKEFFQFPKCPD